MATLSPEQYQEIVKSTKEIKALEQQINDLIAKGVDAKNEELVKLKALKKEREAYNKAIRAGNEEMEAEYKSAEKTYKQALRGQQERILHQDKFIGRVSKINKARVQGDARVQDAQTAIFNIEKDILGIKTKSQLLSYDVEAALESIADQERNIRTELRGATGEREKKLKLQLTELDNSKKIVIEQGKATAKAKANKAVADKLKASTLGIVDGLKSAVEMAKAFGAILLTNPLLVMGAALGAILLLVKKFVMGAMSLQDSLGTSASQSLTLHKNLVATNFALKALGVDGDKVASDLQESFGDISKVTAENVQQVGMLQRTMGMASADTAKFAKSFMSLTGESMETALNTATTVGNLAIANKVAPGKVMADIASNSEAFAAYGKDGGKNMVKAAISAKKLGLEMGSLVKISDSLLDFESSIEKEMEASLMIGKQLNYDRARALALEGDMAGAAQDVMNQIGGQAAFNQMNVLQRRALAESIGVSVEEMSKLASGSLNLVTDEKTIEQLTEKNTDMTQTLNETMRTLIKTIQPLVDYIATLIGKYKDHVVPALRNLAIALALYGGGKLIGGMYRMGKGLFKFGQKAFGKVTSKMTGKSVDVAANMKKSMTSNLADGTRLNTAGRVIDSKTGKFVKTGAESGKKVVGDVATEAVKATTEKVGKEVIEEVGEGFLKTAFKKTAGFFGKKIPFGGGLAVGAGLSAMELSRGRERNAAYEAASGTAAAFPVAGTFASMFIDVVGMVHDLIDREKTDDEYQSEASMALATLSEEQLKKFDMASAGDTTMAEMIETLKLTADSNNENMARFIEVMTEVRDNTGMTTSEVRGLTNN